MTRTPIIFIGWSIFLHNNNNNKSTRQFISYCQKSSAHMFHHGLHCFIQPPQNKRRGRERDGTKLHQTTQPSRYDQNHNSQLILI